MEETKEGWGHQGDSLMALTKSHPEIGKSNTTRRHSESRFKQDSGALGKDRDGTIRQIEQICLIIGRN